MLRVITVAMMTVSLCGSATRIDAYITPTQEGLFEMSEVVAIGTPVANRDGKRASLPAQPVSIPIVEVETDFEVEAVLKGKLESKLITIVHYRLVEPPPPMRLAGPEPRVFDTKPYQGQDGVRSKYFDNCKSSR